MPVDTFHRDLIELIDRRRWDRKSAEEVDRDVRFVIEICVEIYMNGRKGPGPRPMRDEVMKGGEPPPPEPDHPRLLFGAFGLCEPAELRPRRRAKRRLRR